MPSPLHRSHPRPGLAEGPAAVTLSVQKLVREVANGSVRVPSWQRGVKWDGTDVRRLLDSVIRGYPIGSLLLWRTEAPAELVEYGTVTVSAGASANALLVVDGQQRIHALVRSLAGAPDDAFALWFDLIDGVVRQVSRGEVPAETLPLTEVVDSRRLVRWLVEHPQLSEAQREAAIGVGSRIREYQVPAYVVDTPDEEVVREIFERTNHSGKRLTAAEVFDGRNRSAAVGGIRDLANDLTAIGVGALDEASALNLLRGLYTTDLSKDPTAGWSTDEVGAALRRTRDAAARAVRFVTGPAGFHRLELVPYALSLATLTRFFDRHPDPHPRNAVLLERWLWRGTAAEALTGAIVRTRQTLEAVGDNEDRSTQALLETVAEHRGTPFEARVERFNSRFARSQLALVALWDLNPRHVESGQVLPPNQRLPPRAVLRGPSVGVRFLHPPVAHLLDRLRSCAPDTLESHAMTPEAHEALLAGDLDGFVSRREQRVAELTAALVRRRSAWDLGDRPPLRLLDDDPEDP